MFPNHLLEIERELLLTTLFLFLVLNILADHIRIQPHGINAVTLRLEVVSPVGLYLQIRELFEYPYRCSTLNRAHQVRYRDLRRHHADQMNVVRSDIQLHHLASQTATENLDAIVDLLTNHSGQHSESIFRHPNNVILAVPYRM